MTISHITELHGLPVFDFPRPDEGEKPLPEAETVAWRLSRHDGEEDIDDCWERFLDTVDPARVRALVFGQGAYGSELDYSGFDAADQLAAAKDRLTGLDALYLADLEFEECELSWIVQGDVSPILAAYPRLRELGVRGSGGGYGDEPGLEFPPLRHEGLCTLRLENGGLPGAVVRGIASSDLPHLEHLDLWFGVEDYGRDATVHDLAPILNGGRLPALRHLGLRNADIQDELAAAVATAPVVAQLTSLSLGLGALSDAGAESLLHGQPLTHLKRLDLRHHFLSDAMMRRVRDALEPSGVTVDLPESEGIDEDDADDEAGGRYVAASE
ncbi:STM4015 family protein [Streptomyces sp. NPDC021098]|uniref:STM4015 family protein n=1 Tax=unclassified Streptomyces TaxID=2593676 RepID=UPI0037A8C9AC